MCRAEGATDLASGQPEGKPCLALPGEVEEAVPAMVAQRLGTGPGSLGDSGRDQSFTGAAVRQMARGHAPQRAVLAAFAGPGETVHLGYDTGTLQRRGPVGSGVMCLDLVHWIFLSVLAGREGAL